MQALCEKYAAELYDWLDEGRKPRWSYDGTVAGLCDVYERHPESPVHEVKANTAANYADNFKVIRATVGRRAVQALTAIDVKRWYKLWRAPAYEGGPERIKRAHSAVACFRMALGFGAVLEFPRCKELADALSELKFERSPRRTTAMTIEYVRAFISQALARGDLRGLYMAIGVATQFETALRQKDVIGEWLGPGRASGWVGAFTWENIPDGVLRLETSKTGTLAEFDLTAYELLWPLIQMVPEAERRGAIIKGEHGLPIRYRSYQNWFRQIAAEAGLPPDVWNMDARAGAITEAYEANAPATAVSRAATHADEAMTRRYDRATAEAIRVVAEARKRARKKS